MKYNNVLLIDSSYTSFYRFFATKTWYSMAHKDDYKVVKDIKDYNWVENKTFIEKYEKMYLDSIKKIVIKYSKTVLLFCCDSSAIWRNDETCGYKDGRQSVKNNFKQFLKFMKN